jgi:Porin subfamily
MKMMKSLVLGSAAVMLATAGAQAADLPLKAKAVQYVRICSLYGAGFYYIPGTDTCIKLGGYLRVDLGVNTNADDTGNVDGQGGAKNRLTNAFTWRSREDLNIDTRTETEYGVVRTFWDSTFSWTSGSYSQAGADPFDGKSSYSGAGVAGSDTIGVYYAFIQFAGFTMGKAVSAFSTPWVNYPGNIFDGLVGGGGTVTGVNQFTYTAEFGQGVSLAISAQDPTQYYQAGVQNLDAGAFYGASDYGGTTVPDLVGTLRVDQAWGLFQASIAAHDNNASYYGLTELSGHPQDKWGFAGQLALEIKNIPTGPGDVINMQGVYTDGATRYNIQDLAGQYGAVELYGNTNVPGDYQSLALQAAPDTVFAGPGAIAGYDGSQQLIQTWGFRGGYTHNWNPYWNSSIYGAYAQVMYNGTSKTLICANGFAGLTTCNPDYDIAQLGFITRWTPVKDLTFSGDVLWSHIGTKMAGNLAFADGALAKPAQFYEMKDQNNVLLLLRAQRNW